MADFLHNKNWKIPASLISKFPEVADIIAKVTIPKFHAKDQLMCQSSNSGVLSFKDAYLHIMPSQTNSIWGKLIWNSTIPPSKYFIAWRLLHNRMPTDDNLQCRGCTLVSICSLCYSAVETADHLFLHCEFARKFWSWLENLTKLNIDCSSLNSILSICNRS